MKKTLHYTGHRWSTEELKTLMAEWAAETPLSEIAQKLNVSDHSILKMVLKLRKEGIPLKRRTKGHKSNRMYMPWTQPEIEYLARRRAEKATCEEIAGDLGRTWSAVQAMIASLRREGVPIAMRGQGVRRLWNVEALKAIAAGEPEQTKIIEMDAPKRRDYEDEPSPEVLARIAEIQRASA